MICSVCIADTETTCVKCDKSFCNECFSKDSLFSSSIGYCSECSHRVLFPSCSNERVEEEDDKSLVIPEEPFVIRKCMWCTDKMICSMCIHQDLVEVIHPADEIAEPLFRIMVMHFGYTYAPSKYESSSSANYSSYKRFYKNKIVSSSVRSIIHMMCYYLDKCIVPEMGSEDYYWMERKRLLQRIFAERGLFWCPEYLSLYKEWLKTYVPSLNSNRYKKMVAFVEHFNSCFLPSYQ